MQRFPRVSLAAAAVALLATASTGTSTAPQAGDDATITFWHRRRLERRL
ncbi:hypothetical protein [Kribbella turkmenica]|nr:hypothetical protein [Kribbella turkmenica]